MEDIWKQDQDRNMRKTFDDIEGYMYARSVFLLKVHIPKMIFLQQNSERYKFQTPWVWINHTCDIRSKTVIENFVTELNNAC